MRCALVIALVLVDARTVVTAANDTNTTDVAYSWTDTIDSATVTVTGWSPNATSEPDTIDSATVTVTGWSPNATSEPDTQMSEPDTQLVMSDIAQTNSSLTSSETSASSLTSSETSASTGTVTQSTDGPAGIEVVFAGVTVETFDPVEFIALLMDHMDASVVVDVVVLWVCPLLACAGDVCPPTAQARAAAACRTGAWYAARRRASVLGGSAEDAVVVSVGAKQAAGVDASAVEEAVHAAARANPAMRVPGSPPRGAAEDGSVSVGVWVGVGVSAAALLAVVVVGVLLLRRKSAEWTFATEDCHSLDALIDDTAPKAGPEDASSVEDKGMPVMIL